MQVCCHKQNLLPDSFPMMSVAGCKGVKCQATLEFMRVFVCACVCLCVCVCVCVCSVYFHACFCMCTCRLRPRSLVFQQLVRLFLEAVRLHLFFAVEQSEPNSVESLPLNTDTHFKDKLQHCKLNLHNRINGEFTGRCCLFIFGNISWKLSSFN